MSDTLLNRVEDPEHTVGSLAELPDRFDDLASRFGGLEIRFDSLATRVDGMETRLGAVEKRLGAVEIRLTMVEGQIVQLRTDMNAGFSATREDLGRRMRVLHEDVIARIALLGERLNGRSGPRADRTSKRRKG